ncbi:HesB/IscA family protein [Alicyclobacillus fodiniaquatilis]|jgi:iron-sulfur cluster assembly protein|uniref:HesB/IscA family protein n=1 Tax=Alicyclobacillus fodiniaquatilis TaxID=1661150 RepID=A0ABW4JQT3_9BACL
MITLTENAAEKLRDMLNDSDQELDALRIYTKLGGCTGYSYAMALDIQKPNDLSWDIHGVKVVVDPESIELIDGSEVDYVDDLTGEGFKINNPNATTMCGCGSSFRTADKAGQPGSCE